jgi:hypothetical protein
VDLQGTNGEHDCTADRSSKGNTAAARTVFHEANRMAEIARGWLPFNGWLLTPSAGVSNQTDACNASHDINPMTFQSTITFLKGGLDDFTGSTCRNTGEIASVIDHEWGHALDHHDNDPSGSLDASLPGEAFADIVAQYRQRESCHGYGMFISGGGGTACGLAPDGSGVNADESQVSGTPHCDLDCSGTRDLDWDKHADHTPDTPQNFTCPLCRLGGTCSTSAVCAARIRTARPDRRAC